MMEVIDATLFGLVHDFFKVYLPRQKRYSPHTTRSYQTAMEELFDFVKKEKGISLSEITFEMIDCHVLTDFLDALEQGGCSISTRNHRLKGIRSFYNYVALMDPTLVIHQAEIRKVPRKNPVEVPIVKYMSETAVKALLAQPSPQSQKGLRDQFLMLLMYDTAARVQELVDIRLCDIHIGKTPTTILHGKNSKIRTVPLMKQTVEHFWNYVNVFHPQEAEYSKQYLFYTVQRGYKQQMNESTVRKLLYSYGDAAKIYCPDIPEKVHPHLLRHSRAMHLYQHGMDLTLVSQWLGHAHLDTTLIYAHADTEHKRDAIASATPTDSPLKSKLNSERFTVTDDETLKKLYGLK